MSPKAMAVVLVLLVSLSGHSLASPNLGMYFDTEGTETHHVSLGCASFEVVLVYFLIDGVQEIGGAKFKVAGTGCLPLMGEPEIVPAGVVEGTPAEGLTVTFSPPLTPDPSGPFYLGSLDLTYHCDCFADPSLELSLVAHPDEPAVMLYDSVMQEWVSALGNSVGFTEGLAAVHGTMGMIKRMYR